LWYLHGLDRYKLSDDFGFKLDTPSEDHDAIIDRLIAYYRRLKADAVHRGIAANLDMWTWITGLHSYMLDPTDPWPEGYVLADTWGVTGTITQ